MRRKDGGDVEGNRNETIKTPPIRVELAGTVTVWRIWNNSFELASRRNVERIAKSYLLSSWNAADFYCLQA